VEARYNARLKSFSPSADTYLPQTELKNVVKDVPMLDLAPAYEKAINDGHVQMFNIDGGLFPLRARDKEEQVPSNPKALDSASEQRMKSH
jgi:hypothetical protein